MVRHLLVLFRMVSDRRSHLNYVRLLGQLWGDWTRRGCRGLGYGSETSISRLTTSPGRSTRRDYSPDYESDPAARRFEDAMQQIKPKQKNLLYCRFVLQLSDARMMDYDAGYKSEGAARWAVEKAMKEIGKVL